MTKGGDSEELLASLSVREEDLRHREVWLRGAERAVRDHLLPLLEAVLSDLQQLHASHGALRSDAARLLRRRLQDVRVTLSPLSGPGPGSAGGLAVPREVQLCAQLLDESLGALLATLEQLDELRERHRAATSLARVAAVLASTPTASAWDWCSACDGDVFDELARLQETVRSNLVLERYNVALHSFKQWVFPFAEQYLSNETLSTETVTRDSAVNIASAGLRQLLGRMEKYHTVVVRGHDSFVRKRSFEEPLALYEWGADEHAEQLDRLLAGSEVAFWADVLRSPVRDDAVKFDTIAVRLLSTDPSRQSELDQHLRDLLVSMTHMGDSYYKCGSKVFVVSLESQRIDYSVARMEDGSPSMTNKVYDKLREGDMMLSPFALWKVQLRAEAKPLPPALDSFKGGVRLVLEGRAQYVSGFECGDALEGFYTFEPSKSDLNTIII